MLCVAVMLSVMVLGAGAAFSDQDQIENTEAVNMCSALNIIGGYEDGSFHPERNIKRSEITKMICVALNGGKDPNVGTNEIPTFTDVRGTADAWAEGYIESCVAQGIVSGVGGGRFSPAGNVTGSQLAKMLLVSLGYDANIEGFTGNAWETNVNVRAAQKHLYDGLESMDTSAAITRDDAAQMVWNAMQAYEVEYKTTIVTDENGNLVTQNVAQDRVDGDFGKITLLWDKYEAQVATGTIAGAPSSKTNPKGITFDPDDSDKNIFFKNATQDVSDLLGYEVKVVWNTKKVNESDAIYGIYKTDDNASYEAIWADIERDSTNANKVKFGGTSYELNSTIDVYADKTVATWSAANFDNAALSDKVIFIDNNGDGKIDAAQVKTQNVTKITYVGTTNMDTNGLIATNKGYEPFNPYDTDADLSDVNTYEGMAKNDYALVSYDYYNDKVTYEKINAVEAKVEATRTNGGTKEIRIDGTWYKPADGYTSMPSIVSGDTISYIAVGTLLYNVEKTDGTWGSKSLAMVYSVEKYDAGTKKNELEISLITRDGTKKTAFLDKYNNVEVATSDGGTNYTIDLNMDGTAESTPIASVQSGIKGHLVTYRENGNEVSLMPVSTTQKAGYDDVYEVDTTSAYTASSHNLKVDKVNGTAISSTTRNIADDAVVFLYTGNDAKVMSGKELDNAGSATYTTIDGQIALGGESNGVKYIQAMTVGVTAFPTTIGANYAYVLNASETTDGDDYRYFELWTKDGKLEAYEESSEEYTYDGGEIVTYDVVSTENGKTIIKNVDEVVYGTNANDQYQVGAITSDGFYGSNANSIAIGGNAYDLTNDAIVLNVNTDTKAGIEETKDDQKAGAREAQSGTYNILYVKNSDGDIVFALVDGKNNKITVPGVTLSNGATAANVNAALTYATDVTVPGNFALSANVTIPTGKTLNVTGNVTGTAKFIGGGTVNVTGDVDSTASLTTVVKLGSTATQTISLPSVDVNVGNITGRVGDTSTPTLAYNGTDLAGYLLYQFDFSSLSGFTGTGDEVKVSENGAAAKVISVNNATDLVSRFKPGQTNVITVDIGKNSSVEYTITVTAP